MLIYVYKDGDTLWEIATAFGISLDNLILANPQIKDANEINPGAEIYIPQASPGPPKMPAENPEDLSLNDQNQRPFIYLSPGGETLMQAAHKLKIDYRLLKGHNKQLLNNQALKKGDKVFIPQLKTGQSLAMSANMPCPYRKIPPFGLWPGNMRAFNSNCIFKQRQNKNNSQYNPESISPQNSSRPWLTLEEAPLADLKISHGERGLIIICPHCGKSLPLPKGLKKE